jgi:hypothetical protein
VIPIIGITHFVNPIFGIEENAMKKTLALMGILVLTVGMVGVANAGGKDCATKAASSCSKSAETKAAMASHCPATAAKAAYASTLEKTHCEQTAKVAYANAMGEVAYANAVEEKGCTTSAAFAAYDYVMKETGCCDTAKAAVKHAVAQAAYDKCLAETGCEQTAKAKYAEAEKEADAQMAQHLAEAAEADESSS